MDIESFSMKDMAKLKSVGEADALLQKMSHPDNEDKLKSEFQSIKEVEELKKMVEKQNYLLHAFWLLLKEKGVTNDDLDKALNEAVLLEKRKDYKITSTCPSCGKGLQSMENKPFSAKCYYCGIEVLDHPFKRYDGMDPYDTGYAETTSNEPAPYISDDEADKQEMQEAQEVISQNFEPYDVSKDLNFDDENV